MGIENKNNAFIVEGLTEEISKAWTPDHTILENPLLLLIGGFQGAGKSSILQKMSLEEGIILISPDQIRQKLFDRKYPFSENFIQIVEQTNHELVKKAMNLQCSFSIDRNMTAQRIMAVKDLLTMMGHRNMYKIFSIFLDVPKPDLIKRIQTRPVTKDSYHGTLQELEATIKQYGEIDRSQYDLVIDHTKDNLDINQEIILIKQTVEDRLSIFFKR